MDEVSVVLVDELLLNGQRVTVVRCEEICLSGGIHWNLTYVNSSTISLLYCGMLYRLLLACI